MIFGSNRDGAPGTPPGASPVAPGPGPDRDRERLREARIRADRLYGGMLFAMGIVGTIINMTVFTENALAQQFASLSEQYGLDGYTRPAGLGTLALVGVIGQPVIYALALYLALLRWRARKPAAWVAIVGAVVAVAFSAVLMGVGIALHPELVQAAQTAPPGTPTP